MYIEQIMYGHTIYPYLCVQYDAWYVQLMSFLRVYSYGWMDKMREHCSRRSFAPTTAFIFGTYFSLIPFFCFFPLKIQCHWASYELSEMHSLYQQMCEAFIDLQWPKISWIYYINWSSSLWIRRIIQLQTRIIFFLVLIIKLFSIENLTARYRNIVIKPNRSFFGSLLMQKNLIFLRSPDVCDFLHSNRNGVCLQSNKCNFVKNQSEAIKNKY